MNDGVPPELEEKHRVLSDAIEDYFRAWWKHNDVEEPGDYIASWALVANFGNLRDPAPSGYVVETGPTSLPPHAIKGLFSEGVDWTSERQLGEDD